MGFFRIVNGIMDRIFIVAGAFFGSQIPQFMQQYTQRLAGHVEELHYLLDQIRLIASHRNLDQYIYKFLSSSDQDFVQQGVFMQTLFSRWQNLSSALQALNESSLFTKPFVWMKHFDYDMAWATLKSYQPGFSLTLEGIYYTFLGILFGFLLYQLISKSIQFLFSSFKRFLSFRRTS
jgi:predicted exporter